MSYFVLPSLLFTFSSIITSVEEERAGVVFLLSITFCAFLLLFLSLFLFLFEGGPLPLGAWESLRHFIVAFPESSISLFG